MDTSAPEEINLRELFGALWKGKWLVIASSVLFGAIAATLAFTIPKKYASTIVVAPVSNKAGGALGSLGSLASQFGGLASLAGISVGADSTKEEYIAVLQSEELTRKFISDQGLMPVLFSKLWDPVNKKWMTSEPDKLPTLWKANLYFKKKIRSVFEDKKSGLVSLTITWTDPETAARWANDLVKMTNNYIREKKIRESEANIAYLKQEASRTDMVQVQSAIYNVLESEIKTIMLAKGSEEYALRVIDRAVPSEKAGFPRPTLWIPAGFVFGGVLAIVFILIRNAWLSTARP